MLVMNNLQSHRPAFQRQISRRAGHRLIVSVSSFEPGVSSPPPPPPPPPPPMPQYQSNRRDALKLVAVGGLGLVGGYLIGRQQTSSGADLSAEERREIDDLRAEARFRRDYDGHVQVQARDGSFFEVRLDAQIPGTLLLRDTDDFVYFMTLNIQQIDLTDDYVVTSIFGDGAWERSIQKVTAKDDDGKTQDAKMDQQAFRDLISIME